MDIPQKRCNTCGIAKPATRDYFGLNSNKKDGLEAKCIECVKEYHRANKEREQEYRLKWRKSHPDREKKSVAKYRKAHQEQLNEYNRQWRKEHLEQSREYVREWYKKHPEQSRAHSHRREARKRNAEGTHNGEDIQAQLKRQKKRCYYCGEKLTDGYHVDHVIPLSRGGSNGPDNLVIACPICNVKKADRLPHEWPQGGRLL